MAKLVLDFAYHAGQIQLEKTKFISSSDVEYVAVRGKTSGAYRSTGSFQWTPAVKAVCSLFLQTLTLSFEQQLSGPVMSGRRGSLASSLDYAIDKEPQWLCDMFGLDQGGKTNLRRMIFRTNPGSKRPGPVLLSLNESVISANEITVQLDGAPVTEQETIENIISFLGERQTDSTDSRERIQPVHSMIHARMEESWSGREQRLIPFPQLVANQPKVEPLLALSR
jgi:hypothetical protein